MAFSLGTKQFFRVGVFAITGTTNKRRAIVSQTWMLDPLPTIPPGRASHIAFAANMLLNACSPHGADDLHLWQPFNQQIWPSFSLSTPMSFGPVGTPLNVAAPEAALRLQRVGADGSLGRIGFPILNDAWFTDRPHRRQVDLALVNSRFASGLYASPQSFTFAGGIIQNVIIHRAAKTYSLVDHFDLLPNPVRYWKRWAGYDFAGRHVDDNLWGPDNLHGFTE